MIIFLQQQALQLLVIPITGSNLLTIFNPQQSMESSECDLFKAVPSFIFVSHPIFHRKPTLPPGKKNEHSEKKRILSYTFNTNFTADESPDLLNCVKWFLDR